MIRMIKLCPVCDADIEKMHPVSKDGEYIKCPECKNVFYLGRNDDGKPVLRDVHTRKEYELYVIIKDPFPLADYISYALVGIGIGLTIFLYLVFYSII